MISWIQETLVKANLTESAIMKLELAVEEALVNIVRHAYKNKPEEVIIQLECIPKMAVRITLIDRGPAFNPLEKHSSSIDPSIPLEEIEEGGLGILFIRKSVDQVLYERINDQNILTLIQRLH